jgi:hypothetical protein
MHTSYELPKPEGWEGSWRLIYTPSCLTVAYIDGSTHSFNGDEHCSVTDYRAARYLSFRGKDYTVRAAVDVVDGALEFRFDAVTRRGEFDKYCAPTYAEKIRAAVTAALQAEYEAHPERWVEAEYETALGLVASAEHRVAEAEEKLAEEYAARTAAQQRLTEAKNRQLGVKS